MASSSLSLPTSTKYDVFIHFRGDDVRCNNFVGHLKKELKEKNIDAFVYDMLKSGQDIASSIFRAIQQSDSSLVIFSENYANSTWCLEELVNIMDCKNRNKHIVIPIFYNIDPSVVRHQKGSYASAFSTYHISHKEKVQSWRFALHDAANLSGIHYSKCSPLSPKDEAELVEKIEIMLTNLKAERNRWTRFGAYAASTSNVLDNIQKTSGTTTAATNYGQQQLKPLQYGGPYNYQSSVQYGGPYNFQSKMLISQNQQGIQVSETFSFVGPENCNCARCNMAKSQSYNI